MSSEKMERLKEDAAELLKKFSAEYLKCFGMAMVEKIRVELEGEDADSRKLHYRDWDTVERPELFSGWCYVKKGCGPGDFGKWKKVWIAERQDYSIDVYASDKDHSKGKEAKKTISTCGYHLERDVSWFYKWAMSGLSDGLGMTDAELEVMASFSSYAWALVHPWRTNYVFQLHKGKDPACSCLGGNVVEPDGTGAEFAEDREKYLEAFDRCVAKAQVRDLESAKGMAFEMCREKLRAQMEKLWSWEDDGKESEMLTDALMLQCMVPLRDDLLADLKGPVSIRMVAWYKMRGGVYVTLGKLVDPAWTACQKGADQVATKVEPVLRKGLGPVFQAKNAAKDKIREKVTNKLAEALSKHVTPYVEPVFKAFDAPMTQGFAAAKEVFDKEVVVSKLPDDNKQMSLELDEIPRRSNNLSATREGLQQMVEPLRLLKKLSEEIFGAIDAHELRSQAEDCILKTLDAAVYKLENMIEEQGKGGAEDYKQQILKEYDHDVMLARAAFMKKIILTLLVGNFKKIVNKFTQPALDSLGDVIPEEMMDFLDLGGMLDEIIDFFVGEPIAKMVDSAYPVPK